MERQKGSDQLELTEGKTYFRKRSNRPSFRKILHISEDTITYRRLDPLRKHTVLGLEGKCSLGTFQRWLSGEATQDLAYYYGGDHDTHHLIHGEDGQPLATIRWKKLAKYLKKGVIREENGKFVASQAYKEALLSHFPQDEPYLLEYKHTQCAACGSTYRLTKHHVVPRHALILLPVEVRKNIRGLILCLCLKCHSRMEQHLLTHPLEPPPLWKDGQTGQSETDQENYIQQIETWLQSVHANLLTFSNLQTNPHWRLFYQKPPKKT